MITLLFPIAGSDRNHIRAQVDLLKAFGPYFEDRAVIMPTPTAMGDPVIRPCIDELSSLFAPENLRIEVTPNDFNAIWPYAPGSHFRFAMDTLDLMGWDNTPSLWMEPDLNPIKSGWLRAVSEDYLLGGTPFRGMIEKTRYEDTNPVTKEVQPRYDGTSHLVGAGMYPPGYVRFRSPLNNSPMASYRNPSQAIPFDIKCQDQHRPASQSALWVHKPRTVNWRREGGLFVCEDQKKDPFGLTYAGPVDLSGICLVHGCKDGSLARAILAPVAAPSVGYAPVASPPTTPYPTAVPDWAPPVPVHPAPEAEVSQPLGSTEQTREELLEGRIQDLEQDLAIQVEQNQILSTQIATLQTQLTEAREAQQAAPAPPPKAATPAKKAGKPAAKKQAVLA
jgi:hypothetical protein